MLKRVRLRIQSWWARRFYHVRVECPNCDWRGFMKVAKGTPLKHAVVACPSCGVESCCRHIDPEAVRVTMSQKGGAHLPPIRSKPGLMPYLPHHLLYDPKTKVFLKRYDTTTV